VTWPVVLAAGGPRERGRAYGEAAASRVQRNVEIYEGVFGHYAQLPWADVRRRAGAFVQAIEGYDVQLLPELEGIAEGAAIDAEDVLALNLRTEVMFGLDARAGHAAMKECTAIASAGPPVLVGQNWDWKPAVRETCVLLACAPHDRPGFVTLVEAGLWAKCGANTAGVALATNALQSSRDRGEPGVPYHAILRRILTSASEEEAVTAVRTASRASSANYLIGHRDGSVVDLETIPGGPEGIFAQDGPLLAHANHFAWPGPRPFKDVGRIDGEDSLIRHACAARAIEPGSLDVDTLEATLRSHDDDDGPVCVHEHVDVSPVQDYATIASVVANLTDGTVRVSDGNPCTAPYDDFDVAALVERARTASMSS
jgi:isopenicillin-N N-acyltransferase like protein